MNQKTNHIEDRITQLAWLDMTAHSGKAILDVAIGDADKRPDAFFTRRNQLGLTVEKIIAMDSFYRAANSVGIRGRVDRALNIYIKASNNDQSWLMLDDLSLDQCNHLSKDRAHMIVETSPGKHHLWLVTSRPISVLEREICQKVLQKRYGGDAGSTDGEHLGRLVGFKNQKEKYGKTKPWVNLIRAVTYGRNADVDSLLARWSETPSPPEGGGVYSQPQAKTSVQPQSSHTPAPAAGRDESCAEFGWACGWIKRGNSIEDGIAHLAERARGRHKPTPERYARLTFQNAAKAM